MSLNYESDRLSVSAGSSQTLTQLTIFDQRQNAIGVDQQSMSRYSV